MTWEVDLVPISFKYPAYDFQEFGTHLSEFKSFVQSRGGYSVTCVVENFTNFILVLDNAYSNGGGYHYKKYVLAPNNKSAIGAWGDRGVETDFWFSIYRVEVAVDENTFGLQPLPDLGLPGLNTPHKTFVGLLHLRLTVPNTMWERNSIAVCQNESYEAKDGVYSSTSADGRNEGSWSLMKGGFSIQSGDHPTANVQLYLK
jgi:hypothetical protein